MNGVGCGWKESWRIGKGWGDGGGMELELGWSLIEGWVMAGLSLEHIYAQLLLCWELNAFKVKNW